MSPMRRCPWCAESIQPMARICRYCQREVEPVADPASAYLADAPGQQASPDNQEGDPPNVPPPAANAPARTGPPLVQTGDRQFAYRSQLTLVKWMTLFFGAYMLMAIVAVWSGSLELELLTGISDGRPVTEAQADENDARQRLVGLLQLSLYMTLVVLFLIWISRANKNARALGADGLTFTPSACVWWWFAPLFWFWKPYQAVKEIYRASTTDWKGDWRRSKVPALVGWWWFFWIMESIISLGGAQRSFSEDLDELITGLSMIRAADALDIPLTILVILVVRRISDAQEHRQSVIQA